MLNLQFNPLPEIAIVLTNPFVTAQPANAVFSSFTAVNTTCDGQQDVFKAKDINTSNSIDSSQYFYF